MTSPFLRPAFPRPLLRQSMDGASARTCYPSVRASGAGLVGAGRPDRGVHEPLRAVGGPVGLGRPLLFGRIVLNFAGMHHSGTAVALPALTWSGTVRRNHPLSESAVAYLDGAGQLDLSVSSEPSPRRQKLPPTGMFVLVGTSPRWPGGAGIATVSPAGMRSLFDVDRGRKPAERHSRRPGSAALSASRLNTSPAQS